jgi:DNA-binding response OmpR family regulator
MGCVMIGDSREAVFAGQTPGQWTVLLVEDEFLVRTMIADRMREEGFTVVECSDAKDALAVLRSGTTVHAIITDIRMPGPVDGIRLANLVRADYPTVKILLASGHLCGTDAVRHDGFFGKPYDVGLMIAHIRALLR